MKEFIFFALIILANVTHAAPRNIIVIGDSISAASDSWVEQYRGMGAHVKNLSQGGRSATFYDITSDLVSTPQWNTVVYALGTNDGAMSGGLFAYRFKEKFYTHIATLGAKKFKVYVLVPPLFVEFAGDITPIRNYQSLVCAYTGIKCIQLQDIWDDQLTLDHIHPNSELSGIIAQHLVNSIP